MKKVIRVKLAKVEVMKKTIFLALVNSGVTGRFLLNPQGPSFFCVGCGSTRIDVLGYFVPTDKEVLELSGYRSVVYGACDECMEKGVEFLEEKIINLLRQVKEHNQGGD